MEEQKNILVAYTTKTGSTAEVAEWIGETLRETGTLAEVHTAAEVLDIDDYSGVVICGPMILGWHRRARRFVKKYRSTLSRIPYHVVMMAMEVTGAAADTRIFVDPGITKAAADAEKLSAKERNTTVDHYTSPLLSAKEVPTPRSIGIFGGKLDYTKMKFPQMLFVMLVIGAKAGDRRNWDIIREWTMNINFEKETE